MSVTLSRLKTHERIRVPAYFLRGRPDALVDVLPKYPNSIAPILFHLPARTAYRVLEDFPLDLAGPAFVENGTNLFGLSHETLKCQLPRWRAHSRQEVSMELAKSLSHHVLRGSALVPVELLPRVIEVTGLLTEHKLLSCDIANRIVRKILPRCLDSKQLSRADVLSLLGGIRRIPASKETAIVFPMLSAFSHWYLERTHANGMRRKLRLLEGRKSCASIPAAKTTIKQIFN